MRIQYQYLKRISTGFIKIKGNGDAWLGHLNVQGL
jgi:hypothetical protein